MKLGDRIRYFVLAKFGHGKHCDRALTMAYMLHEHMKECHYASCEKCTLAVDFIEPEYAHEADRDLRADG